MCHVHAWTTSSALATACTVKLVRSIEAASSELYLKAMKDVRGAVLHTAISRARPWPFASQWWRGCTVAMAKQEDQEQGTAAPPCLLVAIPPTRALRRSLVPWRKRTPPSCCCWSCGARMRPVALPLRISDAMLLWRGGIGKGGSDWHPIVSSLQYVLLGATCLLACTELVRFIAV